MYLGDTIAAISTPPGRGGIGVVRLSGPQSIEFAESVFRPSSGGEWNPRFLRHGWLVDEDGRDLDEALAVLMRAPHSYTGEDVLELQCHGSPAVLRLVMERLLASGARLADPGEFTERAFLNGRLDLAQAEAIVDLIEARGSEAARLAADQLHGGLSRALGEVRQDLIDLKALLEVQIDFADEEVELDPHEIDRLQTRAASAVAALVESYTLGRRAREGARVVIAGRPNVGKSSLLNALLGEERAIVTEIAGTTRDVIEESIEIAGIPVVLSDTAGLRAEAADEVERIGIERTGSAIGRASVALVVVDGSCALEDGDLATLNTTAALPRVIVVNKSDLPERLERASLSAHEASGIVGVSARRGEGLSELRQAVAEILRRDGGPERTSAVLTNLRHLDALKKAGEALCDVASGIERREPADVIAVAVQDALDCVGEITGRVTGEDVLDRVFSRFCLGK